MKARLKKLKKQADFAPGFLGMLINPFFFARRGLYKNMKALAQNITGGSVLDVGCGQKPYRDLFDVPEYIGMEVEQSGHDHTNENIDVYYDGKTFPFTDERFDNVICNEVLEHVFEPKEFLFEIYRVLKPGGKLLMTVPFVWDEHEQPYDYARYSSFGLKYLLKQSGFEIITHCKSTCGSRVVFQLFNTVIYKKTIWIRKHPIGLLTNVLLFAPVNMLGSILSSGKTKENVDLYLDNIILARKSK